MLRNALFILLSVAITCVGAPAYADDPPEVLAPGAAAPALKIAEWVKGEPVKELQPGTVYVVEFWATWCTASKRAISKLNGMQNQFGKDLRVIAVSAQDEEGETLSRVRRLVDVQGKHLSYSVAFDDRRKTTRAWMDAAEERTIPTVFVVDRAGIITWIGNPLWPGGEFEDAVEKTVAGKFGAEERTATKQHWQRIQQQLAELEKEVPQAIMDGNRERAVAALDRMIEINPSGAPGYAALKIQTLLAPGINPARAYEEARKALKGPLKDDPQALNEVAWAILDDEGIEPRDNDLAFDLATRAVELTGSNDAPILDTLALACARRGQLGKAIELQTRAVEISEDTYERAAYVETLEGYRAQRATRRTRQPE